MKIRWGINGSYGRCKPIVSKDGIIRGEKMKAAVQNMKPIIILRPFQKLSLLQLRKNDIKPPYNLRMTKIDKTKNKSFM